MKPLHYWLINKQAFLDAWDILSNAERHYISNDVDHESGSYENFVQKVKAETESRFQDPHYWFNDPFYFKTPYYNP